MKNTKPIYICILLVVISLCIISCKDNYELKIKNESGVDCIIEGKDIFKQQNIKNNEEIILNVKNATSATAFICSNSLYKKVYTFRDVDHYFGMTHKIKIYIKKDGVEFEGTRSERFTLEGNDIEK